jgi:hypothetical protein
MSKRQIIAIVVGALSLLVAGIIGDTTSLVFTATAFATIAFFAFLVAAFPID